MYIEKVKITIKSLGEEQYTEFILKLRNKLKYKFGIDTKPSELKKQVDNFLNNKTEKISIRYLEAYLLTLNDLSVNGGIRAIIEGKITSENSWRDLIILATQDQPLPLSVNVDVLDEVLIKEIKSVFINIIKYCANENKEVFRQNIQTANQFLSIKKDLD